MPIYEYRCNECQQTFEEWQKDFAERQVPCPVCGAKSDRLISSTSFVLKGGGWYADLYSKPAEKKTESSGADAAPAKAEAPSTPCSGSCAGSGAGSGGCPSAGASTCASGS